MSPVRCVQMHYITPQKRRAAFQRNYYLASAYPEHYVIKAFNIQQVMGELVYKEASVSSVSHAMPRPRVLQPAAKLEGRLYQ